MSRISTDFVHLQRGQNVWRQPLQWSGMVLWPCPNTPMDESEPIVGVVGIVEEISWLNFGFKHAFWTSFWDQILGNRSHSDSKSCASCTSPRIYHGQDTTPNDRYFCNVCGKRGLPRNCKICKWDMNLECNTGENNNIDEWTSLRTTK